QERTMPLPSAAAVRIGGPVIGLLGAGNYASSVLVPAFAKTRARLRAIVSANGLTGTHLGKKFGFELSTTDIGTVLSDPQIDTVVVATRHDSHAGYVVDALKAGKNVFVEKPLAIRLDEIDAIARDVRAVGAIGRC